MCMAIWKHDNTFKPEKWPNCSNDIFKCIFVNENVSIAIQISLEFVTMDQTKDIPALLQILAWRRPGKSHYLTQWWLDYRRIYASLGLNEIIANWVSAYAWDWYLEGWDRHVCLCVLYHQMIYMLHICCSMGGIRLCFTPSSTFLHP